MTALKNDRVIRALLRQPTDITPIWIMRQAGRYLPEYRKLREQAKDFITLYKTPALAAEATLQPIRRYSLDAAIIFSDILIIPEAMGMQLSFKKNHGPAFGEPIAHEKQIQQLRPVKTEEQMPWLTESIRMVQNDLDKKIPLIGFVGSPWTLAVYMVEGKSKTNFAKITEMLETRPELLQQILDQLVKATADCLNAQIQAGVQCVMLFDSWGGILNLQQYLRFSLEPMKQVIKQLTREHQGQKIPCILFTKGGGDWLKQMADSGCDALGLDWNTDIKTAREQVGQQVALQGNLNPAALLGSDLSIRQKTLEILEAFGDHPGHVFNLGHGITPDVDPEKVAVLIDTVHQRVRESR